MSAGQSSKVKKWLTSHTVRVKKHFDGVGESASILLGFALLIGFFPFWYCSARRIDARCEAIRQSNATTLS